MEERQQGISYCIPHKERVKSAIRRYATQLLLLGYPLEKVVDETELTIKEVKEIQECIKDIGL